MDRYQSGAMERQLMEDEKRRQHEARDRAVQAELTKYRGGYRDLAVSGVLPPRLLQVVRNGGWGK